MRRLGLDLVFGEVERGIELCRIGDFDPAVGGDNEDGWRVYDADARAEGAVGLYLQGATLGGVDEERHGVSVGLEPGTGEAVEVVLAGDALLMGEDIEAVGFGGLR